MGSCWSGRRVAVPAMGLRRYPVAGGAAPASENALRRRGGGVAAARRSRRSNARGGRALPRANEAGQLFLAPWMKGPGMAHRSPIASVPKASGFCFVAENIARGQRDLAQVLAAMDGLGRVTGATCSPRRRRPSVWPAPRATSGSGIWGATGC